MAPHVTSRSALALALLGASAMMTSSPTQNYDLTNTSGPAVRVPRSPRVRFSCNKNRGPKAIAKRRKRSKLAKLSRRRNR